MSSPLNMEQIALLAGERADMLQSDGAGGQELSDFINTASVLYFINIELAALWDHLIMSNEEYCSKRWNLTTVADQEDYSLPEDFYKLRMVFPLDSSGNREEPLRRFHLQDLGKPELYRYPTSIGTDFHTYRLMGKRLFLDPIPQIAGNLYEVWYCRDYPHTENKLDYIPHEYPKGWEDYVVEGVTARLLEKIESDSGPQRQRQNEVLGRIVQVIEDRDQGDPHTMIDTEDSFYWYRS